MSSIPDYLLSITNSYLGSQSTQTPEDAASVWKDFLTYLNQSEDAAGTVYPIDVTLPTSSTPSMDVASQDYLSLVSTNPAQLAAFLQKAALGTKIDYTGALDTAELNQVMLQLATQLINSNTDLTQLTSWQDVSTQLDQALAAIVAGGLSTATYVKDVLKGTMAKLIASMNVRFQALYMSFMATTVATQNISAASNALSPQEIEARRIAFEIFNLALKMLNTLQTTMKEQSKLLDFYAKYQNEYVQMMRQLPLYGPTRPSKIQLDLSDFGNTTFGYSTITAEQIVQYLAAKSLAGDTHPWFYIKPPDADGNSIYMTLYYVAGSWPPSYRLMFLFGCPGYGAGTGSIVLPVIQADTTLTGVAQQNDLVEKAINSATQYFANPANDSRIIDDVYNDTAPNITVGDLKAQWSGGTGVFATGVTGPQEEAWPDAAIKTGTLTDAEAKIKQTASSYRAEVNATLQQYLQNAQSMKDQLADLTTKTNTLISQTKDALQNQQQLISSLIESLSGLITAIFR